MKIVVMRVTKKDMQPKKRPTREELVKAAAEGLSKIDFAILSNPKYRKLIAIGYAGFLASLPMPAMAAGSGTQGGLAILKLMQQASFWVGIGVVVWGIVEAQLDLPGWKGRIMKGIIGYIAILLVPMLFITLRDNLQIDVWTELNGQ